MNEDVNEYDTRKERKCKVLEKVLGKSKETWRREERVTKQNQIQYLLQIVTKQCRFDITNTY